MALERKRTMLPQNLDSGRMIRLADELTFARHLMTENELKLWLITISSISNEIDVNSYAMYQYDINKIADLLKIHKRKARKSIVRELFRGISDKKVRIMHRYAKNEDLEDWLEAHLYSSVEYSGSQDYISVSIDPNLIPYLTNLKEKFTEVELQEITSFNGITPIRVYLLVKELMANHTYEISVDKFKERLGMETTYERYNDFKRYVLTKAEKEIRKHSSLKNFHFSDNGCRGRKATMISLSINAEDPVAINPKKISNASGDNLQTLVDSLSSEQKSYYSKFLAAGISPEANAYKIVATYDIDIVISNYEYYAEMLMKRPGKIGPGYLVKTIQNDYAGGRRAELLERAKNKNKSAIRVQQQELDLNLDRIREDCKTKAIHYVKNAPVDVLIKIVDAAYASLYSLAQLAGIDYDIAKAKTLVAKKDLRYKENMLLVELLTDKIKTGEIIVQ